MSDRVDKWPTLSSFSSLPASRLSMLPMRFQIKQYIVYNSLGTNLVSKISCFDLKVPYYENHFFSGLYYDWDFIT